MTHSTVVDDPRPHPESTPRHKTTQKQGHLALSKSHDDGRRLSIIAHMAARLVQQSTPKIQGQHGLPAWTLISALVLSFSLEAARCLSHSKP